MHLSDNAEVDADIRIRMAIPNDNVLVEDNDRPWPDAQMNRFLNRIKLVGRIFGVAMVLD